MTTLFLSYARGDDGMPYDPEKSFVTRLARDLRAAGFDVWFDRESMPSRSLTFHQEIRDSIAARDRLVLVTGPHAAASEYVRQEWQFAYFQADKIVTPILRAGDYPLVPDELKLLHCEDFRDDAQYEMHLKNLVRQLSDPPPPRGKLIAVPSLPPHFLSRTDRLTALRDALRADLEGPVVIGGAAARIGLHGMGGIGKSVLAAALVRDHKVREAFPDGIVWVGFGALPQLADRMREVHRLLGGDGSFTTEHEGKMRLKELLTDKAVLLVLDDAWRRSDVDAFDVLGPRCRAVVTTRDAGLLTSLGGVHHVVELLTDREALEILASTSGVPFEDLPSEASDIIAECGRLPLAVALCGGMVGAGRTWNEVLGQLRQARIDRIADRHAVEEHHRSIWQAIHVSIEFLRSDRRLPFSDTAQRFLELAVFPPDEPTPDAAVGTLWSHTGGLDNWDSQELLLALSERSLVQLTTESVPGGAPPRRHVSLHDLVYDYVQRASGEPRALHGTLLAAYQQKCPDGWIGGPDDGYFHTHLRHHLTQAGRGAELADLLHDLRWLEAKNELGLAFDLPYDFAAALPALPAQDDRRRILRLLDEALRRDLHFIDRHRKDYPQGLFQCLWNTCWWYDCPQAAAHHKNGRALVDHAYRSVSRLLERWRKQVVQTRPERSWLRSLRPAPFPLGSALLAILPRHADAVTSVVFSPDGQRIASASIDKTIRVSDVTTGAELVLLRGHDRDVRSVAFSPDGLRIASAGSWERTVRIWDAATGANMAVLRGHEWPVQSVTFSPDGKWIASGSWDRTVRIWDADSKILISILRGHSDSVTSVAFSPCGMRIASGSVDKTIRVWHAISGNRLAVLHGHEQPVTSVAFSPDGRRIASGGGDKTIRVWDAVSGTELAVFHGQQVSVECVAFSPDGRRIASGGGDKTVRVWDAVSGNELAVFRGHDGRVTSASFSPDGTRIASGAKDRTVRVWDTGVEIGWSADIRGHEGRVTTLAFSADGRRVVSGSRDRTLRVWDVTSGAEVAVLRGHQWAVKSVAFSDDDRWIASGGDDQTIRIWDAGTWSEVSVLCGHDGYVTSVTFSPDGSRIISGSFDNSVRVWDTATGAQLAALWGHERVVTAVEFSSDGERIISRSEDKTLRIWDARSGKCLEVLRGRHDPAIIGTRSDTFPYRTSFDFGDTAIKSAATAQVLACFPEQLRLVVAHISGRLWAGSARNHVYLFALEDQSKRIDLS